MPIPIFIISGIVLVLILLIGFSLRALKRHRLMEDLPTSKTTGVFIGLVELKGTAESENPHRSFLAEQRCVWYFWTVQEHWSRTVTEHYRDSDGKMQTRTRTESGWTTVASGGETHLFYLKDDLGVIRIDPNKAEIHSTKVFNKTVTKRDPLYYGKGPAKGISDSTGERCFSEQAISLHQPIYVIGQAREREDYVAAEIAYDRSAPLFLISTRSAESHRAGELWTFWGLGIFAVFLSTGIGIGLTQNGMHQDMIDPMAAIVVPGVLGGGTFAIWFLGWLWTVYNSLIGLKNRVKMAAANIEVELKRRNDLIPQLVKVVDGLQKHERDIQETTALLRSQVAVLSVDTDEGTSTPAQGCAARLIALVEHYPELKANDGFLKLEENLIETDQRIALARNYYNDVVCTYNTRCERVPEGWVAILAGLRPVSLFTAENFEREAFSVNLVE
jgi:hypothetical protein